MSRFVMQARATWRELPARVRRLIEVFGFVSLILVGLSFVGSREVQIAAIVGLFALFIVVQGLILLTLWRQHPEVRRARRLYMAGDFEGAIRMLREAEESTPLDTAGLTLLGNAYRQVGRLDESEQVLVQAHEADPNSPIAAYGLGRTRLAQGRFDEAAALIELALERRAQPTIVADLALAQVYAGQPEAAAQSLRQAAAIELEPHRRLMAVYLQARLSESAPDEAREDLSRYEHGLGLWRAEAARFSATPYGVALAEDIGRIEHLLAGGLHEPTEDLEAAP